MSAARGSVGRMTVYRYYVACTIDGRIADPDDGLDWLLAFGTEPYGDSYERLMAATGCLVMGSRTYEFVLRSGEPWPYGDTPTWVFTRRELPAIPAADLRFVGGDVVARLGEIAESAAGRDVWLVGGGALVGAFDEAGALDEIVVTMMPVLLGGGKPLFEGSVRARSLEPLSSQSYQDGAIELTYRVRR